MKIGMIGSYDITHQAVCGQSDKTELFLHALQEKLGDNDIKFINSYNWKKHKVSIIISVLTTMLTCKNIIIMNSVNGTKILYKIISVFQKFTPKKFYHIVVGGQKNITILEESPALLAIAKSLDGIYVELPEMVDGYKKLGVDKVMHIPNVKKISTKICDSIDREEAPYRFCVYSKINREKGVPEAIEAVVRMNVEKGVPCKLDIYGVVDPDYQEELNEKLEQHADIIRFMGKVDRKKSLDILSHYYAMLFPTHHPEGVPGAMIDAYEAGLPIISSNSFYMKNIIHHEITGFLVDEYGKEAVVDGMLRAINEKDLLIQMRTNCRAEAQKYNIDAAISAMIKHMTLR